MTIKELESFISVAREDLANIHKRSLKDSMKDVAKKALGRPSATKDMIFWPAGVLLFGLTEAISPVISESLKTEITTDINSFIKKWQDEGSEKVSFVDDSVFGAGLLGMYKITDDEKLKQSASKIYDFLNNSPKNRTGSIIYNPKAGNDYIFADGAGQSAMFLSRYGAEIDDKAFELAATQLINYYDHGMDFRSGLPYHAFTMSTAKKLGLLGWGRAMGWLIMGYAEFLTSIYKTSDIHNDAAGQVILPAGIDSKTLDIIKEQFINLVRTTLSYQRLDGGFSWQLQSIEGEPDTSATAMIGYALAKTLECGLFREESLEAISDIIGDSDINEDKITKALLRMQDFLLLHTDKGSVQKSLSGCEDIGVHRQVYGHYPWGQGAALAMLTHTIQL
ncbi:glycoside hydrolase family 88 protein [Butyrivibrio sp. AE3006]|uniref:glycoside hydrolase family 88 protein n=1 Tax=Butyrivibrio sp. AE3006 TaxID=1280673 RepID=UPI0004091867|nr:glycoside hydrolase family 88 protein [Butyrivibrio sp. AE3006]